MSNRSKANKKQKNALKMSKIKAQPRETQAQDRITASLSNPNTVSSQPPNIDWRAPSSSPQLSENQINQLFAPSQPLPPSGQGFLAGRALDYPLAINTATKPRTDEPIKYSDLKILANNCELVRLAIETRKNQMMKLKWNIVLKDPDDVKQTNDTSTKIEDPRIDLIEKTLEYPDGEHSFVTWMCMLLDQMLMYDAPCVFPHLNLDGSINRLMVVDGSTIKRVIDLWGRTPLPTPDMPNPPAYQQIIKGVPLVNFTQQELIYFPFNPRVDHLYGYGPVEQIMFTANMFMRRQSLQINYFTEGTLPDVFFELPVEWTPDQIDNFANNYYEVMSGNDAARRRGKFLPGGTKINQTKAEMLKDEFDEWLARVICFAFSLPPTAFVKQMSRASAEQAQEAAIEEGLAPLMIWFKSFMDYIIKMYFKFDDLEFQWEEDLAIDPLTVAQVNKINLEMGLFSKNEIRQQIGADPTDDGDKAFIVAGQSIVLMQDVMDGATRPPPPPDPNAPTAPHGGIGPDGFPRPPPAHPASQKQPQTDKLAKSAIDRLDRERKYVADRQIKLEDLFNRAFKLVAENIRKQLLAGRIKKSDDVPDDDVQRILNDLNVRGFSTIKDATEAILEQVFRDGGARALHQIGLDDSKLVDLTNEGAIKYAQERGAELVSDISQTTRDMLRGLVTQSVQEDWTVDKLSQEIMQSTAFGDYRSKMIAQTEIAKADMASNMATYRASGVVKKKQWLSSGGFEDEKICVECIANTLEGAIPIDQNFQDGSDSPPSHPSCRCTIIPILDDE